MKLRTHAALLWAMLCSCGLWSQEKWHPIHNFSGQSITFLKEFDGVLYAGVNELGLFNSTDGREWTPCKSDTIPYHPSDVILFGNKLILATKHFGLFRKDVSNSNCVWEKIGTDIPTNFFFRLATDGNMILANTDRGLYRSQDQGNSWTLLPLPKVDLSYKEIMASHIKDTKIYAATQGYVLFSDDNGENWRVDTLSTSYYINGIRAIGPEMYALTSGGGIYQYLESAATWVQVYLPEMELVGDNIEEFMQQSTNTYIVGYRGISKNNTLFNTGLTNIGNGMTLTSFQDKLYAGDRNGQLWCWGLTPPSIGSKIQKTTGDISTAITLKVQPTMANSYIDVAYELPEAQNISLSIMNNLGAKVESTTITNNVRGQNSYSFDISDLPSGNYFVTLQAKNQILTQKFIILP